MQVLKIISASKAGVDTSSATLLMDQAENCKKKFDYKQALSYAIKSGIEAEKSKDSVKAWDVEISAYMN